MQEPRLERQQAVQDLLQNLKGLEPLKMLFWTDLNYDRVNQPLSRRGWKESVASLLAVDPVLFASGADAFHVIYARLASDRLLIGDERPVVSRLLQEHPYALFVFSDSKQEHFHFLNVKYDDDVQKRRLFRRITVGPNEQLRTASERITLLDLADVSTDLFGLSPLAIQQRHDDAFDVEPVTKEFFSKYRQIFEEVEEAITGFGRDKNRKRLYTQRLFNRLMFIAFIQKKGWLKFNGDADYLAALWKAHLKDNSVSDKNFYRDRLKRLFFDGLNTTNEVNRIGINRGGFLKTLIGDVPYLNGGLFEDDEDDNDENIKVPDKSTGAILNGLFAKFNFTVTESTPLDVEVAVDPEMLGMIFEELVTGRHESGSYYTPKPIVSFMCREALKGYLETNAAGESKSAIERFVEKHEPDNLRNAENILDALRRVKVCDLACGSGAYLLGMLHELLDLRATLFQTKKLDSPSIYQRKLEIIQTNVYGVDIDPFAVNIARLRLWLSLAVDFEGTKPEPLPNLDYKVECGDSVCSPNPSGGLELGFRKALIDEFLKLKSEYLTAHHSQKRDLKKKVETLRADIVAWAHKEDVDGFDWPVEYAEVFLNGGFDVVLANPPWVRQELIVDQKPAFKKQYGDVFDGRADLYCYFYARGLELLRPSGMLCFISSNKWIRAKYGAGLRERISKTSGVKSITDFGELPVFEAAATFPMILIAQKGVMGGQPIFTQVQSLDLPYPDVPAIIHANGHPLSESALNGPHWQLADAQASDKLERFMKKGKPLKEFSAVEVYCGIKTGCNAAFWIDEETKRAIVRADPGSAKIIKPIAKGDDIRKWHIKDRKVYLIFTPPGTEIDDYPGVKKHLAKFRDRLESRAVKQPWWELQQAQNRKGVWQTDKIVYPDICKESRFTLDEHRTYIDMDGFILPCSDLYLLGVLNSKAVWWFLQRICAVLGNAEKGGRLRLKRQYVEKIPIPEASKAEKDAIAKLVRKCLDARGVGCEKWEKEIEDRVLSLFGFASDGVGE